MRERIKKTELVRPENYNAVGTSRPAGRLFRSNPPVVEEKNEKKTEAPLSKDEKFRRLDIILFGGPIDEAVRRTRSKQ